MSTTDNACPCGSEQPLAQCCLPFIQGKATPKTAEALLRSRYTAFTRGEVDYILSTHHSKTKDDVKREEIESWSKGSEWLGLKILQKLQGEEADERGEIAFHAKYKADGKVQDHYEHSLFEKEEGKWKFVDAQGLKSGTFRRTEPKVGRNDPCSCGSGKKYKKCHGQAA